MRLANTFGQGHSHTVNQFKDCQSKMIKHQTLPSQKILSQPESGLQKALMAGNHWQQKADLPASNQQFNTALEACRGVLSKTHDMQQNTSSTLLSSKRLCCCCMQSNVFSAFLCSAFLFKGQDQAWHMLSGVTHQVLSTLHLSQSADCPVLTKC